MEESENRRERLKAMRAEAAQGADEDSESLQPGPQGLCNPLAESETSAMPSKYTSPRFDFYTDPMAAFSNKRKNSSSPQVDHGHPRPRPVYPDTARSLPQANTAMRSPHEAFVQAPAVHYNQSPLASPVQAANTFRPRGNTPGGWGGSRAAINYSYPPNNSHASNYQTTGFGQGDFSCNTYGRGRGQPNYNTQYESGRGRGRWNGNRMSPGPGLSGRGPRGWVAASSEMQPHLFYKKEMVEDPWKMVHPSPWKGIVPLCSNKSWPSKSNHLKKAKVPSELSQSSATQPSLAEYLASSFNESATEATAGEPST